MAFSQPDQRQLDRKQRELKLQEDRLSRQISQFKHHEERQKKIQR
ncbi:hypothetical protein OLMES_0116 [Oleiphilus messinensis]|uniref:Uncharacterized protein n=1 Tax=Oleiphilus messinensis TaxID=141451 RepID=A0A1Y0I3X3_9GAMM|nr:hypothetical protein [Oleiphilus messinensis]ARU54225.1 hypothetical protein OLMES_0116 [Oleiphilus messinensis]